MAIFTHINEAAVNSWLQSQQILYPNEQIDSLTALAGGNMNLVYRLQSNQQRTWVLKKAFPYVYKYPQVPAPAERLAIEAQFYKICAQSESLAAFLPKLLLFDADQNLLLLEDLGQAADYGYLYQQPNSLAAAELTDLLLFLSNLHQIQPADAARLDNKPMRQLNHEYIFVHPFKLDNGLDLDQITLGLAAIADGFKRDEGLLVRVKQLGAHYLSDGNVLLHGDFYPCSWLRARGGLKIIDVEFAFCGAEAFDYGVLYAHLCLSGQGHLLGLLSAHCEQLGLDKQLWAGYAGVEIFRRILGLAQLPIQADLELKKSLLAQAYQLLMDK